MMPICRAGSRASKKKHLVDMDHGEERLPMPLLNVQ